MTAFDFATHRAWLHGHALPAYASLGRLAFAYLHGSLVSGYTQDSDLDVVLVWAEGAVPVERGTIVAFL